MCDTWTRGSRHDRAFTIRGYLSQKCAMGLTDALVNVVAGLIPPMAPGAGAVTEGAMVRQTVAATAGA